MKLILKIYCPLIYPDGEISTDYCLNYCSQKCKIPYFLRKKIIEETDKKIYHHIFRTTSVISSCPYQIKYMLKNKVYYIEMLKKPITIFGTLIHESFDKLVKEYESNSYSELKLFKKYIINNKKVLLTGICDYVKINDNDNITIIDWKFMNVKDKNYVSILKSNYAFQLNVYKNLIQDKFNKKVSDLFLYIISNQGIGRISVPIFDYDYVENFIKEKLKDIIDVLSGKTVEITNENLCKFCPYLINKSCPYKIADTINYTKILEFE